MNFTTGSIGQWVGLFFLAAGLGIEIAFKADIGYICLTGGSLIFSVATKFKYHKSKGFKWPKLRRRL